jgi:hypothetical protein
MMSVGAVVIISANNDKLLNLSRRVSLTMLSSERSLPVTMTSLDKRDSIFGSLASSISIFHVCLVYSKTNSTKGAGY